MAIRPTVVHGTQKAPPGPKFNPRPKNAVDRAADKFLNESRDPQNRPGNRHAEKVADAIIEKQNKGK